MLLPTVRCVDQTVAVLVVIVAVPRHAVTELAAVTKPFAAVLSRKFQVTVHLDSIPSFCH